MPVLKGIVYSGIILLISLGLAGCPQKDEPGDDPDIQPEQDCCWRTLMALPFRLPEQQSAAIGGLLTSAVTSSLAQSTEGECPSIDWLDYDAYQDFKAMIDAIGIASGAEPDPQLLEIYEQNLDLDYLMIGAVTLEEQTGYIETEWDESTGQYIGGDVLGRFAILLQLYDPHHGEVLRSASTTCIGDERGLLECMDQISSLADSFKPVSVLLAEYEQQPTTAAIALDADKLFLGEEITVQVSDIRSAAGQTVPAWWRLFVEAEHGEIVTRPEEKERFAVFRSGEEGSFSFTYRAPDTCPPGGVDTITIHNTCNHEEYFVGLPETVIATASIPVDCGNAWTIDVVTSGSSKWIEEEGDYCLCSHSLEMSFRVDYALFRPTSCWMTVIPPELIELFGLSQPPFDINNCPDGTSWPKAVHIHPDETSMRASVWECACVFVECCDPDLIDNTRPIYKLSSEIHDPEILGFEYQGNFYLTADFIPYSLDYYFTYQDTWCLTSTYLCCTPQCVLGPTYFMIPASNLYSGQPFKVTIPQSDSDLNYEINCQTVLNFTPGEE